MSDADIMNESIAEPTVGSKVEPTAESGQELMAESMAEAGQEPMAEPKIIRVNEGAKDGQTKCPRCGSTDIAQNANTGKLRCNFCRYEFEPETIKDDTDISTLEGMTLGAGATDIIPDTSDLVTLKCESCGAEVVIDTASATQARCHWCRNTLSINKQVPNGAVPDMLLPFKVKKEEAQKEIQKFVKDRKFFAHPRFIGEFTTENICGVYFPYMVIDVNGHMDLSGTGEIKVREYTQGSGDDKETYYDADAYHVERSFDIAVDDLTIEASSDKLNVNSKEKTTNIINAIMPFDTDNCVKYDSNFLKGYTSEKRDINIPQLRQIVHAQTSDVARFAANDSLEEYDRGVAWSREKFDVKGESWKAAYLPVWLYSYMQKKGNKNLLHYVAVNARTKETMGSVPINMTKLWLVSIFVELFGFAIALFLGSSFVDSDSNYRWLFLLSGFAFFGVMYMRYRNANARHTYESETKRTVSNLVKKDEFLEHREHLRDAEIEGENTRALKGNLRDVKKDDVVKALIKGHPDVADLAAKVSKLSGIYKKFPK